MTHAYSYFGPQPIAPCRGHALEDGQMNYDDLTVAAPALRERPVTRPAPANDSFCDRVLGTSDGGSTDYYRLPAGATELNDLIEHKRMSFALGNIFKACYRFGEKDAASRLYDINKIIYFAERMKALERANERRVA